MRLYLDGQEEKIEFKPECSLGQMIDQICSQKIPGDRVITQIRVNGEELLEDENGLYPDIPGDVVDSLELKTGLAEEMAKQGLSHARDYLEKLNPGIEKTAELFRTGADAKALDQYGRCMDGINWFIQILEGARQVMGLDYKIIHFNKVSVHAYLENLHENIREMLKVQCDEDWVMLSDLLEYEMLPMMDGWKEILPLIEEAARDRKPGAERVEATEQSQR